MGTAFASQNHVAAALEVRLNAATRLLDATRNQAVKAHQTSATLTDLNKSLRDCLREQRDRYEQYRASEPNRWFIAFVAGGVIGAILRTLVW